MTLFLKCLLGALAVLVIALLSRTRSFYVAGLVPLFPTFALIAHAIVGAERGGADLRTTAIFGLWSLLPYAVYLLAVATLAERLALAPTLVVATGAWVVAAAILLLAWNRLQPVAGRAHAEAALSAPGARATMTSTPPEERP
jgi:membrane protein GlpM